MNVNKTTHLEGKIKIKHGYSFLGEYFAVSGKYIIVTPGNFYERGGFKNQLGKEKYYSAEFPQDYILSKEDLVIAMTEQGEGLLGSCGFIPIDDKYLHNQRIGLITVDSDKVDKKFAHYLFNTNYVRKQIRLTSSGSKVKHTSPEKLYEIEVLLPELSKQKKIGSLLFTIDEKIIAIKSICEEIETFAKFIYDYWFIQFNFPNHEGKPYKLSGGEMEFNEELNRPIPKTWGVKKLKNLISLNRDKHRIDSQEYETIDLSVMPINSMTIYEKSKSSDFGSNLYKLSKFDLLVGGIRPYLLKGGIAPYDGLVTGTVQSFRVKDDAQYNFSALSIFHRGFFRFAENNSKGTKMPVVSSNDLLEYPVPFKKEVVEKFNEVIQFKETLTELIFELHQLEALKKWIHPMIMNGQVTVGEAEKKLGMVSEEGGSYGR